MYGEYKKQFLHQRNRVFSYLKLQEKNSTYAVLKDMQHVLNICIRDMHNSTDEHHRAFQEGSPLFAGFPG